MIGSHYGEFALESHLGEGGMGDVWRARHLRTGIGAAVKIMRADMQADPTAFASFEAEVGAVARCSHPNIVRIFDFGVQESTPWFAMELLPAGDLGQSPPRSWAELQMVLAEILSGLAHAHARGVVHRDLKPANVLRSTAGVKITDFGLAHRGSGGDTAEQLHVSAGTPYYMSPEQVSARWRDFGPWTDLYAVGCVAYDLASGRPPFVASHFVDTAAMHLFQPVPPLAPRFTVPDGFEAWIATLLVKDPIARLATAAEALSLLEELVQPRNAASAPPLIDRLPDETLPLPTLVDTIELGSQPAARTPSGPALRCQTQIPRHLPLDRTREWGLERESLRLFAYRPIPLTGREAEASTLWEALHDVAQRRVARVVLVRGPSGCGKSRLARWVGEAGHEHAGCRLVRGTHHAPPTDADGLRGVVTRTLRLQGLAPPDARARIGELLQSSGGSGELTAPLAAVVDDDGTGAVATTTATHHVTLRRFFGLAGRGHPCVLVLDDVHLDPDSCAFLESIADAPDAPQEPLLVIATLDEQARSEHVDRLLLKENVETLTLGPLPTPVLARLVRDELRIDPELALEIAEVAGGFTVYATQIVAQLLRSGELVAGDRGLERAFPGQTTRLPRSAHEVWQQRVTELLDDETALLLVGIAAALGSEIDAQDWQLTRAALGLQDDPELFARLARAGLLDPTAGSWSVRYRPFRRAVQAELQRRGLDRLLHGAIAKVLEGRAESPAERVRLAHHLFESGSFAATLQVACDTLHAAIRTDGQAHDSVRQSLEIADQAIAAGATTDAGTDRVLRIARAAQVRNAGLASEALDILDGMQPQGDALDVYVTLIRATSHQQVRDFEQAHAVLEAALQTYHGASRDRVRLLTALARVSLALMDVDEAERHALECLDLLPPQSGETGWVHHILNLVHSRRGDVGLAREANERARACFEAAGFLSWIGITSNTRGELLRREGAYLEAMAAYTQSIEELARVGGWTLTARVNRAIAAVQAGQAATIGAEVEDLRDRLHGRQIEQLNLLAVLLACAVAADLEARDAFDTLAPDASDRLRQFQRSDDDVALLTAWIADRWRSVGDEERAARLDETHR